MVREIKITNFKSLNTIELKDCKTFNIFIGRPNVGKSNIIEALSLLAVPYLFPMKKSLESIFRIERAAALFHDGDVARPIAVQADEQTTELSFDGANKLSLVAHTPKGTQSLGIVDLKLKKGFDEYPAFKPYYYAAHANADWHHALDMPFLCPWDGNNIMQIIQQNDDIKQYFVELLREYDLQLTFDMAQQELRVMKQLDDTSSFIIPYKALADSIKRLMFYKAAVDSNHHSVLMFEELEAHAYPPYITKIAQTIIHNPSNQYFITTHSPYVVNEFLEDSSLDVAIHIVDYRNGQTVIKTLSKEELDEVYNYGIDLFFNTEAFLD